MLFMSLALLNPLCLKLINEHKSKMMVSRWKHINPFTSSIIFKIELEIKINMFCRASTIFFFANNAIHGQHLTFMKYKYNVLLDIFSSE